MLKNYLVNNSHTGTPDKVRGWVIGVCGMRKSRAFHGWAIDHIPSGLSLGWIDTEDQAIRYLKALDTLHLNCASRESAAKQGLGRKASEIYRAVRDGTLIMAGSRTCSF